jgi:lysophospholipase L1-like esterase
MKTQEISKKKIWIFSLLVIFLFFGTAEAILRMVGFEYYTYVKYMNFYREQQGVPSGGIVSEPNKDNMVLVILHKKDPVLFWRNVPNIGPVSSQGFVNSTRKTYELTKSSNVYRIISLGGSCTNRGWVTYPERLENLLNEANVSDISFEVINAGVGGYGSYQGMNYFVNELHEYAPDLITVYFGWNDHWRAIHYPDKEQPRANKLVMKLQETLDYTRIYQFLNKTIGEAKLKNEPIFRPRVSLSDYRSNIVTIISTAKKKDIEVLLMTAPEAFTSDNIAMHERRGLVTPDVDPIKLHKAYNEVIREIAASEQVEMVDLESIFNDLPEKETYFLKDGIHHRDKGLSVVAHAIFAAIKKNGMLPERSKNSVQSLHSNTVPIPANAIEIIPLPK